MDLDPAASGFSGVLLTGGTAARMDGADKSSLQLDGRTLLDRCLAALADAAELVVVGQDTVTMRPVTFTREDPPFGGPVAGLLAGVDALLGPTALVGVLAVDMPQVTADTFRRLREAADGRDGAFLTDDDGRRQLCGVLAVTALVRVRRGLGPPHGMAMRTLLADLDLATVAGLGEESRDVDTWADLRDLTTQPATHMAADTCTEQANDERLAE